MSIPRPIAHQIACVRHIVAAYRNDEEVRVGAEEAIATLEWLQANAEAVRAAYRLMRDPAVTAVLAAFPGAEIGHS